MKRTFSILVLALLTACAAENEQPAVTQTTIVVSAAEDDPRQPIVVRNFVIGSDSVRRGQAAKVHVDLEAARPAQQIAVDWYGPDGWLVAYETRPASAARLEFDVPVQAFEAPGRYRAVLRAGTRPLAEDSVTVTG